MPGLPNPSQPWVWLKGLVGCLDLLHTGFLYPFECLAYSFLQLFVGMWHYYSGVLLVPHNFEIPRLWTLCGQSLVLQSTSPRNCGFFWAALVQWPPFLVFSHLCTTLQCSLIRRVSFESFPPPTNGHSLSPTLNVYRNLLTLGVSNASTGLELSPGNGNSPTSNCCSL